MAEDGGRPAWLRYVPWGFVFFVITVAIAVHYGRVVRKARPVFTTVSVANVLDIHRELGDLTVLFRGEDIQAKGRNLKIYTVKLTNAGDAPLRQGDFDPAVLWGLEFAHCEVIEVRVAGTNDTSYLQPKFTDWAMSLRKNPNGPAKRVELWERVELPACLMNPGDYVILEIVVLHSTTAEPTITTWGKVAGATLGPVGGSPGQGGGASPGRGAADVAIWLSVALMTLGAAWLLSAVTWRIREGVRAPRWRALVRRHGGAAAAELGEAAEAIYQLCERATPRDISFFGGLLDSSDALAYATREIRPDAVRTRGGRHDAWVSLRLIDPSLDMLEAGPPPNLAAVLDALTELVRVGAVTVPKGGVASVSPALRLLISRARSLAYL